MNFKNQFNWKKTGAMMILGVAAFVLVSYLSFTGFRNFLLNNLEDQLAEDLKDQEAVNDPLDDEVKTPDIPEDDSKVSVSTEPEEVKDETIEDEPKEEEQVADLDLATMIKPTFGTVYKPFADEELLYSKTLDAWITHMGIDIMADLETPVYAALKGTVSFVGDRDDTGYTVVIDHGSGIYTLYGNLKAEEVIKMGMQVEQGAEVGKVGETSLFESLDPPHLHFALMEGERYIDPTLYLDFSIE